MKRFFYLLTVMVFILANNSHAMEKENSSDNELKKWEKMAKQNFVRCRNQTRTMPESPKRERKPSPKRSLKKHMQERRKEKRRMQFKDSIREQVKRAQLRRARSLPPYPKGRRYTESITRFREQARWGRQRIQIPTKTNRINTATILFLLTNQSKKMNKWWFTLFVTALYELINMQNPILKLPFLSETFKYRLANALRGGLYANIVNALAAEKLPPYIRHLRIKSLNGWKVIGSYVLIDLVSKYGWDVIKKIKKKPAEYTDDEIEKDYAKQSSNLMTIIDWGVKTIVATAVPDLLT